MRHALQRQSNSLLAALDIGTTKITCIIAEERADKNAHIISIGQYRAQGIKSGLIVNMEAAQNSIKHAVHEAEKMAGERISTVIASLSSGRITSNIIPIEIPIAGDIIHQQHIKRILTQARQAVSGLQKDGSHRYALHAFPLEFTVDNERGISDPRGMTAQLFSSPIHVVTANLGAVQNLTRCIEACRLKVSGIIASPIASASAVLSQEEKDLGCTLIDIGGGTTNLAIYHGGTPVYTEVFPIGGRHITSDIATVLPTTLPFAEELKTKQGSATTQKDSEQKIIKAPLVTDPQARDYKQIRLNLVHDIIAARVEEIFDEIAQRLETPAIKSFAGRRVVLTGGVSKLPNLCDVATYKLQRESRIARNTQKITSQFELDATHSTSAGLICYALRSGGWQTSDEREKTHSKFSLLSSQPMGHLRRILGL